MSKTPEYLQSELPAIELFQKMGYQYLHGAKQLERTDITETIFKDRLLAAIKRINPWIDENNLNRAYSLLTSVSGTSLMEINEKIWHLIKGGTHTLKQVIDGVEDFHPIYFIDYKNPENNDFLVVNQLRYHGGAQHSIPDLVVYINGLPIAIIECKSPTATNAWDTAYDDINYYQKNSERLFHFNQLCVGIWKDGGRYGALGSPQQFYSIFRADKEEDLSFLGGSPTPQDILLSSLFRKERILDLIRHFVLFEIDEGRTIKKLPRHQQLRATNKTIARLKEDEGGVVWHTQGSGKSLTMVYIARKLQAPEYGFENPTILVMTDRKDLDRQITNTFNNTGFGNVSQATSVAHLQMLLSNDYGSIITTTIQKFQETDREATTQEDQTELEERGNVQIELEERGNVQIEKQVTDGKLIKITKEFKKGKWIETNRTEVDLESLSTKKNLYVMVDEAHRSHYGFLAAFMRAALPHAKFIAFTGTPISKEDKSTLGEFYGGDYIDVYTIKESVADGATVELLYDEGIAMLDIKKEELDKEFEEKFKDESEEKKDLLKRKALQKYQLSKERIRDISKHIVDHYRDKIYPDKHKAMIVCSGRPAAIKYQETLLKLKEEGYHNFESKVVISLGSPKADPIAKEHFETLEWNKNNPNNQKPILVTPTEKVKTVTEEYKLPFGDESEMDRSGRNKKYDNTAFIIVSDMLLTGWDAPIASCLYLDKPLKEHNLLQAIARVNRSREGKNAGFIVDYNGISEYLIQALEIFSGDLRPDDILKNINEELPILELNHNKLVEFFKPLKVNRKYEREKYIDKALLYIEPLDRRDTYKTLLKDFNKSINIVLPNTKAIKYQEDFKLYNELKLRAKNAYPDDEGLRISPEESRMLQGMIDEHLKSEGVENLLNEPISIIDKEKFKEQIMNASPETKELKMRNNIKHTIKVGMDKNPDFFKPLAERLEELIKQQKEKRIHHNQLLLAYAQIQDEIIDQQKEGEEKGFTTERSRAVFNSMKTVFDGEAEEATKKLFSKIEGELGIIDWQNKGRVKKDIENKIKRILQAELDSTEATAKAREMVDILVKNKG